MVALRGLEDINEFEIHRNKSTDKIPSKMTMSMLCASFMHWGDRFQVSYKIASSLKQSACIHPNTLSPCLLA